MDTLALLGSTLGLGVLAGVRLYATVLGVGLAIRFGFLSLHPSLRHLDVLAEPWVLGVAGALFLAEFVADKVPWFDSFWDSIHTVIRPVGAAFLGFSAFGSVDPKWQTLAGLATGALALSGHSAKAGSRLVVNHSPEPFSNIALSLAEDALVFGGTWLAIEHPILTLVLVGIFVAVFAWLSPKLFRLLRLEWTALASFFRSEPEPPPPGLFEGVPPCRLTVRCAAEKGVRGLRNSIGWLCVGSDELIFVTRRLMRRRVHRLRRGAVLGVELRTRLLFDSLELRIADGAQTFLIFRDERIRAREIVESLTMPILSR
ncbi:MAG: DUF4126 domain-containing protein [Bryobacteraceae bacterium]|nr:DUF4126 domain-containing protein [Bryobacteraceae bacterium]